MIIKLPRNKVEIIETLQIEQDDMDVDIETNVDLTSLVSDLKSDLNSLEYEHGGVKNEIVECKEILENDCGKQEILDDVEKKPDIDEIVRENLQLSDAVSGLHSGSEGDVCDDEDADPDWKTNIAEKDFKSSVLDDEDSVGANENSESQTESEDEDEDWSLIKKKAKPRQKTNDGREDARPTLTPRLPCLYCEETFTQRSLLVKHTNNRHLNPYECHRCSLRIKTQFCLQKHLKVAHGERILACPLCRKTFPSLEVLRTHSSSVHNTSGYACVKCDRVYTTEAYLETHTKGCFKNKVLTCEACGKVFNTKFTLEVHLARHMGIKYECKVCAEQFADPRSMYRHKLLKHDGKTYHCSACGRDFADDRGLVKHMKLVHKANGGMPEKYQCTMCDNRYWQKITLARHIKNDHSGGAKSMITIAKKFNTKRRVRTHHFECDRCRKTLVSKNCLREHLRSAHYGLFYACTLCSKRFGLKVHFRKHQRSHEMHAFPCGQCDKVFVTDRELASHARKCFSCSHCLRSFRLKTHLVCHIQGYHFLSVNVNDARVKVESRDDDYSSYSVPEKHNE